jgi:hypothetical protein
MFSFLRKNEKRKEGDKETNKKHRIQLPLIDAVCDFDFHDSSSPPKPVEFCVSNLFDVVGVSDRKR